MAGTVTRSGDSIGSVSRPQSAVPARMAARQRSVAPAQILISDLRMGPLELAQQGGEDVEADGHAADEADRAAQRLARIADQRDRVLQILEDAVTELQQRFAGRRDADAPADAQEDGLVQLFFEQQDLPADRRLRHVQPFAGSGEGAGFGDGADDFELPEIHAHWRFERLAHADDAGRIERLAADVDLADDARPCRRRTWRGGRRRSSRRAGRSWRAASRFQSLRIGNSTPSCSRNARFDQVLSTLTPRILVLAAVNVPCDVWYCFISLVQPGENAAGKNATTTFCLPLKSDSLIRFCSYLGGFSLPSPTGANQARSKSGAGSPTLTDGGRRGGRRVRRRLRGPRPCAEHERGQRDEQRPVPHDVGNRSTHKWSHLRRQSISSRPRAPRLRRRRSPATTADVRRIASARYTSSRSKPAKSTPSRAQATAVLPRPGERIDDQAARDRGRAGGCTARAGAAGRSPDAGGPCRGS